MLIFNQVFFVLGVSRSGYSASKYILNNGGKCYIYEELKTSKTQSAISELVSMGAVFVDNNIEESLNLSDIVVISPGIPINHRVAIRAKELNKRIIGELEFGFEALLPPFIAVTGTNGKTTTVSMIRSVFDNAKIKNEVMGNIGYPITEKMDKIDNKTVCITEVSSFQLESVSEFKPHVSCILNITPDHLERHYSMENYIYLKKRIFRNQKESEYLVLNFDDEKVRTFGEDYKGKIIYVSVHGKVENYSCAYKEDNALYFNNEKIIDCASLSLEGVHNEYNALFTIAVCKLFNIENTMISSSLSSFKGVPHRVELVLELDGVKYYDDSKATNTASTISAIKTMKSPTVLILGGSEKGEKYDELFSEIKKSIVRHTVIYGASRINMVESATKIGLNDFTVCKDFKSAVKLATMFSTNGDNVLLSPACASFDEFNNFEERGLAFKKEVEKLS